MNGPSKAEQIRRYKAHNPDVSAGDVADKYDTSRAYVWKEWDAGAGPEDYPEPDTATADTDPAGGGDGIDMDSGDPGDELADLVISDEWGSYACGNDECGADVPYLADECPECETELYWWQG